MISSSEAAEMNRPPSQPKKEPPKLVHEQILDRVHEALRKVLEDYAEPLLIAVCVPWAISSPDLPFGSLIVRETQKGPNPGDLTALSDQLTRMQEFTARMLNAAIRQARERLQQLEMEIHERQAPQEAEGRTHGTNA